MALSLLSIFHGLALFSIPRKAPPSSFGKSLSMRVKYRRISRILSRISMFTGQFSSHARQVVQDQSSSLLMRSNKLLALTVISVSTPIGGETAPCSPVAAITSPVFNTISLGSNGFPVAWAGHTAVHRPHIVQLSVSRSCFQVKSSITEAPIVSMSSASIKSGRARIAPLGRSRSFKYMFNGDVNMCLSMVTGSITKNAMKHAT